ncbi:hypothetical protein EV178_006606 [Coemansia sp. RSA 1646]|nr:hypothetical protein EV178_006606 [Coemansia sp. RSA 1646]
MRLFSTDNQPNQFGVLIEFKLIPKNKRANTGLHETLAKKALDQIIEKRYPACLSGCTERLDIGIAIGSNVLHILTQLYKLDAATRNQNRSLLRRIEYIGFLRVNLHLFKLLLGNTPVTKREAAWYSQAYPELPASQMGSVVAARTDEHVRKRTTIVGITQTDRRNALEALQQDMHPH